jgi:shikimate kinase/3-dehydroquinate synthase
MMRPLLVVGPPYSGKTELAESVARHSGQVLLRADAANLESRLAETAGQAAVIEVDSDAWLDRRTRVLALDRSIVVSVRNIDGHDGTAPAGHDESVSFALWKNAANSFNEAHKVVQYDKEKLTSIVGEVAAAWQRCPVAVAAAERSYRVDVGRGITEQCSLENLSGHTTLLLITDSNVDRLHGTRIANAIQATGARLVKTVFAAGEEQKHLGTLSEIFEQAQRGGVDRSTTVVAVGGGVVTDIAGFAAATWMRGLRWAAFPTTLLGMVDASVGGKTAVDFGEAKNAVGAFWQPSAVVCDVDWLKTESDRNFCSALAEVVKTAIIGDAELFSILENEGDSIVRRDPDLMIDVVRRCVRVKARIVGLDERESGLRAVLNLGHTIGHALEAKAGFAHWSHGEAVSLGLVAALRLGERLGITPSDTAARVVQLLRSLGLPAGLASSDLVAATELIAHDKKRAGSKLRFVFVKGIGDVNTQWLLLEDLREIVPSLAD